jgi:NAD-dependent deacetylase
VPTVQTHDAERVAGWLQAATAVTVLTGAGISTDSGIPDFRGPDGVWTRDPAAEKLFTLANYVTDAEIRRAAWQNRRRHAAWSAAPNAGHLALVELERQGRLRAIVTQNIDELHQRAGSTAERVIEIHGTVFEVECLGCGARTPMAAALDRVDAGDPDPRCLRCGGMQKSATISFGQSLRTDVLQAAVDAATTCDLFLAVGTSLRVHPAAGLCDLAQSTGAPLVVMNAEPTPYDEVADAVLRGPIGALLPELVGSLPDRTPPTS